MDSEKIVGIFDLDNTTTNKFTNDFLNSLQKENKITYLVSDIPKSFILMDDGSVYIVELSSQILKKRFEFI
ncbi:MAG: DUF370 domain-containing protein [Oscillospiraceae bacterium]|nr:DUF370 domain-containing protein [Oscillospiraceae bacterium]